MSEALVMLAVLLPLLLALGLVLLPSVWRLRLGLVATLFCLMPLLPLLLQAWNGGEVVVALGGWQPPLGITLRADAMAVFLLTLTGVIALPLGMHARHWLRHGGGAAAEAWFWPLWLFLWASLNLMFLAGDLFNAYVGLELMGLAAVALVALGGKRAALEAALRYLLLALFASLLYLLGVALLYAAGGTLDLALLGQRIEGGESSRAALVLITLGLVIKGALVPFHFWLPPAHASAPAPVSALLSALVVKAPLVLLLRIWFELFAPLGFAAAGELLALLGMLAILWGSTQALRQRRIKPLVAWSTVAQLGYLFLVFAIASAAAWSASLLHLAAHALAKAALFLAAGNIVLALGDDRLSSLNGSSNRMPLTFFTVGLAAVSLMGLPPSGGFVAKWLLLQAAIEQGRWLPVVVILSGSLLAAGYLFPLLRHGLAGTLKPPGQRSQQSLPLGLELPPLLLALLAILLGVTASWPGALLSMALPEGLQ